MKDHGLLVERYRPTKLENFVGNEHIKSQIGKYLDQGDIQNFIFYGIIYKRHCNFVRKLIVTQRI